VSLAREFAVANRFFARWENLECRGYRHWLSRSERHSSPWRQVGAATETGPAIRRAPQEVRAAIHKEWVAREQVATALVQPVPEAPARVLVSGERVRVRADPAARRGRAVLLARVAAPAEAAPVVHRSPTQPPIARLLGVVATPAVSLGQTVERRATVEPRHPRAAA
jgi:hypothetical protein